MTTEETLIKLKRLDKTSKKWWEEREKEIRADESRKITNWYDYNWSDSIHVLEDAAYKKGQAEAERGFNRTEFANSVRAELIARITIKLQECIADHKKFSFSDLEEASESASDASTSVKSETTVGDKTAPENACQMCHKWRATICVHCHNEGVDAETKPWKEPKPENAKKKR